jgi:hypothetical protein
MHWHPRSWSKWTDPFQIGVNNVNTYGGKSFNTMTQVQTRTCTKCNRVQEREVKVKWQ